MRWTMPKDCADREQRPAKSWIGPFDRFGPTEPRHLLALPRQRRRRHIGGFDQITQIQVCMSARPRVDIEVH